MGFLSEEGAGFTYPGREVFTGDVLSVESSWCEIQRPPQQMRSGIAKTGSAPEASMVS